MLGGRAGGGNGNMIFPGFMEENRIHADTNTLPQLHLFGNESYAVPIQCIGGTSILNSVGNEHTPTDNRPIKRVREEEPVYTKQKLGMSLNYNVHRDNAGHIGNFLNRNPVSTGLRLSCEKEEHSSSITSTCENMRNTLPGVLPLGNAVKLETDRQMEEFGQYIKLQEENIWKGVTELNKRHTISLLHTLEKRVSMKLQEKELEIENISCKNKELEDRIKQASMEAQSWQYRAKHNESLANILKSNIQQLMAQGTGRDREGTGDSEVEDAVSCTNHPENQELQDHRLRCRACNGKRVSILLLPCRHLCLCADCEGFIDVCPICQVRKSASVPVYM
ncbi:UNVERIFIED_CONTAM: putative BOI-related E3 ubiquitin-protein ligase 3 [Sesamum radiatum]|uniref:BOI-related E3 ubiquitin-protein ligase 3 n=1 Tax=Sesamum radiatum TaxID=300843 RepID=A0AAW2MYY6_SESRA